MKTNKLLDFLFLVAIFSLIFTGCKKSSNSNSTTTTVPPVNIETAAIQDAESQDVIITKVENYADVLSDELESSNFVSSSPRSITVKPSDTTSFPKTITLTINVNDTVNGVIMTQNGIITLTVDTIPVGKKSWWRKHVSRVYSFSNYTVVNDSNTITINGTRTMHRQNWESKKSGESLSVAIQDSITSNLTITVQTGLSTNLITIGTFTRNAARLRSSDLYYIKTALTSPVWHPLMTDTTTITGNISGTNLQNLSYSRDIISTLTFIRCPFSPFDLLLNGQIKDTENCKNGTSVITITYYPDACSTNVSATDSDNKTIILIRNINHNFHIWW